MSISTLRRQVKNVALNFSDAQVKVREATSNDPWGPTTALMSEIADLTHNPMSFTEIMSMIWKRLNDHGKNWRHVYKSLVLLDYLIKCGSEKVATQCRENIYSIETLRDFQHVEDNRDQGLNVREKAKQMVSLLNDAERLKNERARFLLTRKRFIQNGSSGISSEGAARAMRRIGAETGVVDYELEEARPSSLGEEEMQLQIAIALSREESEKEKEMRKGDDIRLQIALEESKRELAQKGQKMIPASDLSKDAVDDLLSLGLGDMSMGSQAPSTSAQAYANDPWSPRANTNTASASSSQIYPSLQQQSSIAANDPWAPITSLEHPNTPLPASTLLPFDTPAISSAPALPSNDPWAAYEASSAATTTLGTAAAVSQSNGSNGTENTQGNQRPNVKTPENFLGPNSSLVNLDNLMGPPIPTSKPASNPFMSAAAASAVVPNPFVAQQRPSPSLNEMMQQQRTTNPPPPPPPSNGTQRATNASGLNPADPFGLI